MVQTSCKLRCCLLWYKFGFVQREHKWYIGGKVIEDGTSFLEAKMQFVVT